MCSCALDFIVVFLPIHIHHTQQCPFCYERCDQVTRQEHIAKSARRFGHAMTSAGKKTNYAKASAPNSVQQWNGKKRKTKLLVVVGVRGTFPLSLLFYASLAFSACCCVCFCSCFYVHPACPSYYNTVDCTSGVFLKGRSRDSIISSGGGKIGAAAFLGAAPPIALCAVSV